ncbi:MAG: hypothetical protein AB7U83_02530 [Vicinamibacterales bacterium]
MMRLGAAVVVVLASVVAMPAPQVGAQPAAPPNALASSQTALSPAAQAEFLRTARVVRSRSIGRGVTVPLRLTLTDGTLTHDAAFQSVYERRAQADFGPKGVEFNFADSHHFNLAAYALAGMLDLDGMMPVTVHRVWNGREGTITWWIDDAFDESTRIKEKRQPPNPSAWNQQMYKMRVFAALVGDTDRNLGNVLITQDWKLWMIDFTRAFRLWDELKYPADLHQIDRTLLQRLRELDAATVKAATTHCLTSFEQEAVLKRRDLLVAHFDALIKTKGGAAVLYGVEPKPRPPAPH